MNVAVGKTGKKIYFNPEKVTSHSGDAEVTGQLMSIAACYPDIEFYVVGINDLDKLPPMQYANYFPNNNVHNVWEKFNSKQDDRTLWVCEYFATNDIEIDFGYIHAGPLGCVNVPGKTYTVADRETKKIASSINMATMYAAPIIHWLNESNVPYVAVGEDPRNVPLRGRDLHNRPKYYGASYDFKQIVKVEHGYLSEEPPLEIEEEIRNIKFEQMFLVAEHRDTLDNLNTDRKHKMHLFTHGIGGPGRKKLKIIDEYLSAELFDDMKVYGKWNDKALETSTLDKDRFINTDMTDMKDLLYDTKYTFMFNLKNDWPSSKFWKMIYYGIIPFFYSKFDTKYSCPVHDFLRVSSPEELLEKINALELRPDMRLNFIKYHNEQFKTEQFNGDLIINNFKTIAKDLVGVDIEPIVGGMSDVLKILKEESTL